MDSVCRLHKYACLRGRATRLAEENGKFRTTTAIAIAGGASVCVAVCVAVCGKLHVQTTAASPSLKSSIGSRITITMSSAEQREREAESPCRVPKSQRPQLPEAGFLLLLFSSRLGNEGHQGVKQSMRRSACAKGSTANKGNGQARQIDSHFRRLHSLFGDVAEGQGTRERGRGGAHSLSQY